MHKPPLILIVDDEPFNVDYLEQELSDLNYQTICATDGPSALARVAEQDPDLILLDVMMPGMDGFTVLDHLKANGATRHIPVIVISAMHDVASIVRGIQQGAEDYLPKPFEPVLLQARLKASLEKKNAHDLETLYRQALERELEIGHEIQLTFLPPQLPALPGWELAARFVPASQVAGDFYDAFVLDRSNRLGFVIGDVVGKGVGAALYMALYRTLVRILAFQADASSYADEPAKLAAIVSLTNEYVARTHGGADMFASLFAGLLDPRTGDLTYVNAGHNPPLLISADGNCTELMPSGIILGITTERAYEARQTRLEPGALLIAYTDGIPEAHDGAGVFYGEERLERLLQPPSPAAAATLERIEASVIEFIGSTPQADDITLLALRRAQVV